MNLDGPPQADGLAGVPAHQALGFLIVLPVVGAQVLQPDETLDPEFLTLHEDAESGQARHNTAQLLADSLAEHLENQHADELSFGVLGTLLGETDVSPRLRQILAGSR